MVARRWQLATAVTALAGVGLTGYLVGASGGGEAAPVRTIELDVEEDLSTGVPELEVIDRAPEPGIVPADLVESSPISRSSPMPLDSLDDSASSDGATGSGAADDALDDSVSSDDATGSEEADDAFDAPDDVDSPDSPDS